MRNIFKTVLLISATALLGACGGGGGSSAPAATVASTATFQLRTALANATQQTSTLPYTISGRVGSNTVTGSGSITLGGLTSTTFEGQFALQKVSTSTFTLTVNGVSTPASSTSTSYTDSNYIPVGASGTDYTVVQGTAIVPLTALVNDTGSVYTANRYTSSTKSSMVGTETVTFSLQPDTATTALINIISVQRDNSSVVILTATSIFRLTPAGGVTRVSETATYPNGDNLRITY